jgi:hypothetical protein
MIYVVEQRFDQQLALLRLASQLVGGGIIVAWLYPESNAKSVAGLSVGDESHGLLPVTTYGSGPQSEQGRNTEPTNLTDALVDELLRMQSKVTRCCDSLAIYLPNERDWIACCIHHEKVCMVRDVSLLPQLAAHGFSPTTEAPAGW